MFIYFRWNIVPNARNIGRHWESYLKYNIYHLPMFPILLNISNLMSKMTQNHGKQSVAVCAAKNQLKWNIDGYGCGGVAEQFMKTPEFRAAVTTWISASTF